MKWLACIIVLFLSEISVAQHIPIVGLNALENRFEQGQDTTYVVNFWATWCGPCVKEMPFFEKIKEERANQSFKVLLVSLDFSENLESKVIPFVAKKGWKSEMVLLEEGNPNEWIPRISKEWSGAIPATLFINTQKKTHHFYEGSFEEGELEKLLIQIGL